MNIPRPIRVMGRSLSSNSPMILSGIAVTGVVATAVLAVKATPKAAIQIKEARLQKEWERARNSGEPETEEPTELPALTPLETAETIWKLYLPAIVTGTATIACIIGANQIGMRRNAALMGAYTLVDTAFREYKNEVLEQIGAAKERKVTDAVMVKKLDENPPKDSQVIMIGGSDVLCYESLSGRYFHSSAEDIRRAENDFNQDLLNNSMFSDLNLWFDYLGLEHTSLGSVLGWSVERKLDTIFTSHLTPSGDPCLAIGYKILPFKDFGNL